MRHRIFVCYLKTWLQMSHEFIGIFKLKVTLNIARMQFTSPSRYIKILLIEVLTLMYCYYGSVIWYQTTRSKNLFQYYFSLLLYGWDTVRILRINEENLLIKSLNFLQNAPSNSVSFSSSFNSVPWTGVKFCENVGNIGIIYATEPLLQNMTNIVCLRWLTFDIFNNKPL